MTLENFNLAIRPKVQGSWNLHEQLTGVDFFIMLSSVLGVIGNPSQANYTAGGAFQDALAHHRRARGLPAVAIDLGMVKGVGYVAKNEGVSDRLSRVGLKAISEDTLLRILELAIIYPTTPQIITGIDKSLDPRLEEAGWIKDNRFSALKCQQATQEVLSSSNSNKASLPSQLSKISSADEAQEVVLRELLKKLKSMFAIPAEDVSPSRNLAYFGVDSLVGVELRNWIASQVGSDISIFELMQSPSLAHLSHTILSTSRYMSALVH